MPDTNSATEELGGSTTVSSIDTSPISNDVLKVADELLTQCYRDFPYDGFSRNFMDSLDSSNSSGKGNCVWFSRWFINQFHKEVEATNNGLGIYLAIKLPNPSVNNPANHAIVLLEHNDTTYYIELAGADSTVRQVGSHFTDHYGDCNRILRHDNTICHERKVDDAWKAKCSTKREKLRMITLVFRLSIKFLVPG